MQYGFVGLVHLVYHNAVEECLVQHLAVVAEAPAYQFPEVFAVAIGYAQAVDDEQRHLQLFHGQPLFYLQRVLRKTVGGEEILQPPV